MEDCRGTLHKSRPSLGTLNLGVSEKKNKSRVWGVGRSPFLGQEGVLGQAKRAELERGLMEKPRVYPRNKKRWL